MWLNKREQSCIVVGKAGEDVDVGPGRSKGESSGIFIYIALCKPTG